MTKKFIILMLLSTLCLKLSAQQVSKPDSLLAFTGHFNTNKVVLEVYKIDSAQVNGVDQTERYRKASAAIIFYTQSNYPDTLMTVIMPGEDSESWGEIQKQNEKQIPATKSLISKAITLFSWTFTNTVDGLSGRANVKVETQLREEIKFANYNITADNGVICKFWGIQLKSIP
jgi:hypothetical protein